MPVSRRMRYTLNLPLCLGEKYRWEIGSLGEILDARNNKMIDRTPPKVVKMKMPTSRWIYLGYHHLTLTILHFESNRHVCRYALVFCKP